METKITQEIVSKILKPRKKDAHKGDFGHALIIAGRKGKIGAAVIASRACLRSGVGLLTVHVPKCGVDILQIACPEAMIAIDSSEKYFTSSVDLKTFKTIGIGPGIGTKNKTQNAIYELLCVVNFSIVIDADAINCLSLNKDWLKLLPEYSVLTPHPKEFERLVGEWGNEKEKIEKQIAFSKKYKCILVLKGHFTTISTPEGKLYKNTTGNAGMAKGGSGDALTGIITSFLAQGYSSEEASIMGVYLHGLAGDFAAKEKSEFGMLASDLIEFIPETFLRLTNKLK